MDRSNGQTIMAWMCYFFLGGGAVNIKKQLSACADPAFMSTN